MISVLIFGFLWWSSQHPDNRETGHSNVLSLPPTWEAAMLVSVVCRPSSSAFLTCTISKTCASFWSVAFDCGEDKERIESPEPFPELVHLLLGWHKNKWHMRKEWKASNLQRRGETYCTAYCNAMQLSLHNAYCTACWKYEKSKEVEQWIRAAEQMLVGSESLSVMFTLELKTVSWWPPSSSHQNKEMLDLL